VCLAWSGLACFLIPCVRHPANLHSQVALENFRRPAVEDPLSFREVPPLRPWHPDPNREWSFLDALDHFGDSCRPKPTTIASVASGVLWSPNLACGWARSRNCPTPSAARSCSLQVARDSRAPCQSSVWLQGSVRTCFSGGCSFCRRLRASAPRRTSLARQPLGCWEGLAFRRDFGGQSRMSIMLCSASSIVSFLGMFRGGLSRKCFI